MRDLLRPFRPLRRRDLTLLRQVATIQHGLRDQSTFLGYLWSFLHPLITLLVLYAFFRHRVGEGIPHYGIYLLIGLVQFTHFSKSTASAMRVLGRMRTLATNVIFPKDVLIYSSILADLPEFVISILATVVIALAAGVPWSASLLALPLIIVLQLLLVLWTSLILCMLYVYVRDLDHIYEVAMRLFFFITPIFYSVDSLAPQSRRIALLNPLAQLIGYARTLLLDGRLPPLGALGLFLLLNLGLCYAALTLFRRSELALVERL